MTDPLVEVEQVGFDPLGPRVRRSTAASGRELHYVDEGDPAWPVLLFFGGAGTSVRAFRLLEFARTLREQLRIRVVSVERNGLGQTAFDPAAGPAEHAADVVDLLDRLAVATVAVVAVSGGAPYAAHLAAACPQRVRSLHLAAALAPGAAAVPAVVDAVDVARDPVAWWRFPASSAVHRIPGFVDSTVEEATRALFARGRDVAPDGLRHAFDLYRDQPLPSLTDVTAPAFLYWGTTDDVVTLDHLAEWRARLPDVRAVRIYDGEGHDVQYRHWDQILCDVAHLGSRVVVSDGERTVLAAPEVADGLLADGWRPGLAAWWR